MTRRLLVQQFIDAGELTCFGCAHLDKGNDLCSLLQATLEADWSAEGAGQQLYQRHAECLEAERRAQKEQT